MAGKKRQCGKKTSYPTKEAAIRALAAIPFSDSRHEAGVHYCGQHKGWHLTSHAVRLARRP